MAYGIQSIKESAKFLFIGFGLKNKQIYKNKILLVQLGVKEAPIVNG